MTVVTHDDSKLLMLRMNYEVMLEGVEQLVVDTFNYEQVYDSNKQEWVYNQKEPIKVMLKKLMYSYDEETNQFELDMIVVNGFRKDKKIMAREWYFGKGRYHAHAQYKDVLAQIPDSFHDRARQAHIEMTAQLESNLNSIKRNGVVIK